MKEWSISIKCCSQNPSIVYWYWIESQRVWGEVEKNSFIALPGKRATAGSVQFSSVAQWCLTLCDHRDCSMPGFPVHPYLPKLAQTNIRQVSGAIQPSPPLSTPSPPAFNLSSIRVFSNELVLCISGPKYWNFSFSISPSNEYSGLISFSYFLQNCVSQPGGGSEEFYSNCSKRRAWSGGDHSSDCGEVIGSWHLKLSNSS